MRQFNLAALKSGQGLLLHEYNSLLWSFGDVLDLPLCSGAAPKECYFSLLFTFKTQWSLSSKKKKKKVDISKLQYAAFTYTGTNQVFASAMSCCNRRVFQQQLEKQKNLGKLERFLCLKIAD